jgi:hypothetical protein
VSAADSGNTEASFAPNPELHSLALGVRFLAGALTVASGLFDINICSQIGKYKLIFEEALPGQILPFPTDLIIRFRFAWLAISILSPITGLLIVFLVRSHRTALVSVSLLIAATFVQANITSVSLFSPFFRLMNGMSGNP